MAFSRPERAPTDRAAPHKTLPCRANSGRAPGGSGRRWKVRRPGPMRFLRVKKVRRWRSGHLRDTPGIEPARMLADGLFEAREGAHGPRQAPWAPLVARGRAWTPPKASGTAGTPSGHRRDTVGKPHIYRIYHIFNLLFTDYSLLRHRSSAPSKVHAGAGGGPWAFWGGGQCQWPAHVCESRIPEQIVNEAGQPACCMSHLLMNV